MHESTSSDAGTSQETDGAPRRQFLSAASGIAMTAGVTGAYGTLAWMFGQFVYPSAGSSKAWLYVCSADALQEGESLDFTSPAGAKIVVARQGGGLTGDDFLALFSVCPHLGCRVHWEAQHDRFFCPCHNGAFDRQGAPVSGPPKAASQSLVRFPLKIENGLLFLEVPMEVLTTQNVETQRPHQPCRSLPAEDNPQADFLA